MNRPPPEQTLAASFRVAGAGIARSVLAQRNLRIHLALATVAIALTLALRARPPYVIAVLAAIGLVLTAEILNCAIEAAVDLASPEWHPLARNAKDAAAGAVTVAAAAALAVGVVALAGAVDAGPQPAGSLETVCLAVQALAGLACATTLVVALRRPK